MEWVAIGFLELEYLLLSPVSRLLRCHATDGNFLNLNLKLKYLTY